MAHTDDAKFIHAVHAYGHLDEDNPEVMSVAFDLYASVEHMQNREMETERFWLYREDAIKFAEAIIASAKGQRL